MKLKKLLAVTMAAAMTVSMVACGSDNTENTSSNDNKAASEVADAGDDASEDDAAASGDLNYVDINLGEDYTDITATIKFLTCRTDMAADDYAGTTYAQYIEEFNKMYPNITVEVDAMTNFADDSLLRLQDENWGDIMMIPAVDKADLGSYFLPYGDLDSVSEQVRYADAWSYDNLVYGVACDANAQGIVYNKKVFEEAGITELPKTPEEFIADLQAIADKTDAIPLYTNYAAEWTMGAWDAYISGSATGQADYMNQEFLHTAAPFADPGDGTHAYNVYKILYDAVANGLIEEDYSTTDWEGCKGMINRGEIGTMVLGSWAVSQMKGAGDNPDDVGYMPFPITVDGKQYASAAPDYNYAINVNSSADNQAAAMVFVKWLTEESGYSYNEGALPVATSINDMPDTYAEFTDVTMVVDEPSVAGEEDVLNSLNSESELMVNAGGNQRVMTIVEHASNDDESFDDIMKEWNDAWSAAQETCGVEATK